MRFATSTSASSALVSRLCYRTDSFSLSLSLSLRRKEKRVRNERERESERERERERKESDFDREEGETERERGVSSGREAFTAALRAVRHTSQNVHALLHCDTLGQDIIILFFQLMYHCTRPALLIRRDRELAI